MCWVSPLMCSASAIASCVLMLAWPGWVTSATLCTQSLNFMLYLYTCCWDTHALLYCNLKGHWIFIGFVRLTRKQNTVVASWVLCRPYKLALLDLPFNTTSSPSCSWYNVPTTAQWGLDFFTLLKFSCTHTCIIFYKGHSIYIPLLQPTQVNIKT